MPGYGLGVCHVSARDALCSPFVEQIKTGCEKGRDCSVYMIMEVVEH